MRYSLKPQSVKAHTLAFAPEGWFSVKDYLSHKADEVDPTIVEKRSVFELAEGGLPCDKTLSMRLLRYHRQGLLERRRVGHRFLYKLTEKGVFRGIMLKKRYRSIYEGLPRLPAEARDRKQILKTDSRLPKSLPVFKFTPISRGNRLEKILGEVRMCGRCGKPLPEPKILVCPYCHRLA